MAGEISLIRIPQAADMLDKAFQNLMPGGMAVLSEDAGAYEIWKEGQSKMSPEERGLVC